MYGVLWKYLLIFGFILWTLLCVQDHYRTLKQKNNSYNNNLDENFAENLKKNPPCLTFWKTLSMVLSLGALVYIKRTSNVRKNPQPVLIPLEQNDRNLHKFTIHSYNSGLKQTEIGPDHLPEGQKTKVPAICGVEMVQKKLEFLEQSVLNLKKRHYGSTSSLTSSSPGIVSGSPQFRNFLLKLTPAESSDDLKSSSNHVIVNTDEETVMTANAACGDDTIDDTTDDTHPTTNNFDDAYEEIIEKSLSNDENVISNINTQDSSWCTISEQISEMSDPKLGVVTEASNQVLATPITEILQARQNFCDISKTSIEDKSINSLNSIISFINNDKFDYDENSTVPGSNLVPSEKSSLSSRSVSSHQQLGYFPSFSSLEDDDILLNTLD